MHFFWFANIKNVYKNMSLSFYDIVPKVMIDKVYKYAGCCVNCGELFSGEIVPELGEYYCYKVCGPEYKHFKDEFDYSPFEGFEWFRRESYRLCNVFFSYLNTRYLYGRLKFEVSRYDIMIYGINHYEYDFRYTCENKDDKRIKLNMSRLIIDIMKNTLELPFPEPCCTNGRVIGGSEEWCRCPYGLSYRLNDYFEIGDVKPLEYVKYIKDPYILKILRHLHKNSSGKPENDVIFIPDSCENYTKFFTRNRFKFSRVSDYEEKVESKYGSFIVVDGKTEYTDINSLFRKKSDGEVDDVSLLKHLSIVHHVKSMRSPIVMRFENSSFDRGLLRILQEALKKDENKFWGNYIAIFPKKFLESSKTLIKSMTDEYQYFNPLEYIETDEAFFFSGHYNKR